MPSIIRAFFLVAIVTGPIACGDSSSSPAGGSRDVTGAFAVGHASFNVVDPARDDRPLLVDAWYPVDPADSQESPLTEYPLADPLTLTSEVAVDDLSVSPQPPIALAREPFERQGQGLARAGLDAEGQGQTPAGVLCEQAIGRAAGLVALHRLVAAASVQHGGLGVDPLD